MARNRFASFSTTRLELSDGDWVEVKDELTWGESQQLAFAAWKGKVGEGVTIEQAQYDIVKLELYLVDWSFAGPNGKTAELNPTSIRALSPDTAFEILGALNAHLVKLEQEKNGTAAASPGPPSSAAA